MGKEAGDFRFRPGPNAIVGNTKNPEIWNRPSRKEFASRKVNKICPVCNTSFEGLPEQKFCSIKCLNTLSNKERQNIPDSSNFCSKCSAWRGSLGLEPTFELYIKHLVDIFDEVKRVLRKDGTCWVNIGDTYSGSLQGYGASQPSKTGFQKPAGIDIRYSKDKPVCAKSSVPAKSLCLIPDRFKIEMVNHGWILRNTIIWFKRNCMPSSADDRFTVDFDYLFFFVKSNDVQYWTNEKTFELVSKQPAGIRGVEGKDWEWRDCPNCGGKGEVIGKALKDNISEIELPGGFVADSNTKAFLKCKRCKGTGKIKYSFWSGHDYWFEQQYDKYDYPLNRWGGDMQKSRTEKKTVYEKEMKLGKTSKLVEGSVRPNPQGRNRRCVWDIPSRGFKEAHFATFPPALVEPMIKAGCPEFVCKKCGKAKEKIIEVERPDEYNPSSQDARNKGRGEMSHHRPLSEIFDIALKSKRIDRGYTDCGCNVGFEGGIALDPFIGAGTTAVVAKKLGRRYIGIDISPKYKEMSNKRIEKECGSLF